MDPGTEGGTNVAKRSVFIHFKGFKPELLYLLNQRIEESNVLQVFMCQV